MYQSGAYQASYFRYITQIDLPPPYNDEAWLASEQTKINFNWHADLLDCPRIITVYVNVIAFPVFEGFGDFAAPGDYHVISYPYHTGASPTIVLGTTAKPPWTATERTVGYQARPQILIKWDFTNCNEV